MSHKIQIPEKQQLIESYQQPGCTISSLAKQFNTSQPTVRKWLIQYNIDRKDHKQASAEANIKNQSGTTRLSKDINEKLSNYNWIYDQRIIKRLSVEQIAANLGVSEAPIRKAILHHNIPRVKYNQSDFKVKQILSNPDKLDYLYTEKNLTVKQIAEQIGSSPATISKWLNYHNIEITPANSYPRKKNFISNSEIEIRQFLDQLNIEYNTNDRLLIGQELDIVIPSIKLALEINGLYWHSEKFKDKHFHLNKTTKCTDNHYQLFHIWEDQWLEKPDIIKSMIKNKAKLSKRVYGRNTNVVHVDYKTTKLFLDNNHLQGYCKSSINIGLEYYNDLVALMTFSTPRFNKNVQWELVRYAVKKDHSVVGGFSKLLNYFYQHYKGDIISYADRCYSNGQVYYNNGFELIRINEPSYYYVINHYRNRVSRTMFTKNKFKQINNANLSENDITKLLNIPKLWNCGTLTFLYSNTKISNDPQNISTISC